MWNEFNFNILPKLWTITWTEKNDASYVLQEIQSVLNFDNGFLYTIKVLIKNPGSGIRVYLFENRTRIVKPIIFIILTSFIYSIINSLVHFEDVYLNEAKIQRYPITNSIFQWVRENYGYANIIMGVFIALWLKLFFFKYRFNFFEILVLLCYVMGMGMLIYSVFGIIQGITETNLIQFASILGFIYTIWAIGQLGNFMKNKKPSIISRGFSPIY